MTTTIASLQAILSANTSAFTRELGNAEGRLTGFATRGQNRLGQMTTALARLALPLVALGGASVVAATQWESAFTGVEKTVNMSEEELAALEAQLRGMATGDTPLGGLQGSAQLIAGIAESAGQLDVANEHIGGFTETIGMMTMATDLTADAAAEMAARFANITGMDLTNVDEFAASLVALGNNTAATESEIMTLAMRLAASGASAGMSQAEILALAAAMKGAGIEAEAGGTAFSMMINEMAVAVASGGPELETFARTAGQSAEEFASAFSTSPVEAIEAFMSGLGEMPLEEQTSALDDVGLGATRTSTNIRQLALDAGGLGEALDIANTGWSENTALTEEAERRNDTFQATLNRVVNKLTELGTTIGEILIPALDDVLTPLGDVVDGLAKIFQGDTDGGLDALNTGLEGLGTVLETTVKGAADGVLGVLENITGWELPSVEEGLAAWQPLLDFVNDLWGKFKDNLQVAIDAFILTLQTMWESVSTGVQNFADGVDRALEPIRELIDSIKDGIDEIKGGLGAWEGIGQNAEIIANSGATPGQIITAGWNALVAEFGGGRAVGGQVQGNRAYLVGENGPELFVPGSQGYIQPNGAGGGGNVTNVYLTAYGRDPYELYDMVRRAAAAAG